MRCHFSNIASTSASVPNSPASASARPRFISSICQVSDATERLERPVDDPWSRTVYGLGDCIETVLKLGRYSNSKDAFCSHFRLPEYAVVTMTELTPGRTRCAISSAREPGAVSVTHAPMRRRAQREDRRVRLGGFTRLHRRSAEH